MFAADTGDLALEIANTSFTCVMAHQMVQSSVLEFDLIGLQSAVFAAAWDKIILGYLDLLFFRITRQFDDFHAIAQGRRNGVEDIRGSDEENPGKIKRDVQIMIPEC